jgi:hypothetical protein
VKVTIEKNVPLPRERAPKGYWDEVASAMKVGDSVLMPSCPNRQTALGCALRRLGAGVATRKEKDGVRVWRTE